MNLTQFETQFQGFYIPINFRYVAAPVRFRSIFDFNNIQSAFVSGVSDFNYVLKRNYENENDRGGFRPFSHRFIPRRDIIHYRRKLLPVF